MSTAIFDRYLTAHSDSSTGTALGFRGPTKAFPSTVAAAVERILAAAPPQPHDQRARLAPVLGGA
jgi:hypothetical protein